MEPRYVDRESFLVIGICGWFREETKPEIPKLWERFLPRMESVPHRADDRAYGVCFGDSATDASSDYVFFYMAAVEVTGLDDIPVDMVAKRAPAGRMRSSPTPAESRVFPRPSSSSGGRGFPGRATSPRDSRTSNSTTRVLG